MKIHKKSENARQLAEMGITCPEQQTRFRFVSEEEAAAAGFPDLGTGMLIEYQDVDDMPMLCSGGDTPYVRFRLDDPARLGGQRYVSPEGSGTHLFLPPGIVQVIADSEGLVPGTEERVLFVCEGEKKAAALRSLGFAAIALTGWACWNRPGERVLHDDWLQLELKGLTVILVPDFDGAFNQEIHRELMKLARALYAEGVGSVRLLQLPPATNDKLGIDDYLMARTDRREAVIELAENAAELPDGGNVGAVLQKWFMRSLPVFVEFGVTDGDAPKNLRHAYEYIGRARGRALQNRLVTELSKALSMGKRAVRAEVEAVAERKKTDVSPKTYEYDRSVYTVPYHFESDFDTEPSEAKCLTNHSCVPAGAGEIVDEQDDHVDDEDDDMTRPLSPVEIVANVQRLLRPGRQLLNLSGTTTVVDHRDCRGDIQAILDFHDLDSLVAAQTQVGHDWKRGAKLIAQRTFMCAVPRVLHRYEHVRKLPEYPVCAQTFYMPFTLNRSLNRSFEKFLDFFVPATSEDRLLIACMVVAGFWSGFPKPVFLVDALGGQGSGKTSLVELICRLWWADYLSVDASEAANTERLKRRLVVGDGLLRWVLFLDNANETLHSAGFSALVTSRWITAMGNHARQESRRLNDTLLLVTMNGAAADRDLATRSYQIELGMLDKRDPAWYGEVVAFIEAHHSEIVADILDILQAPSAVAVTKARTRFASFEREVLAKLCEDEEEYRRVTDLLLSRQKGADEETEEWTLFTEAISHKYRRGGARHAYGAVSTVALQTLWCEATGQQAKSIASFGKRLKRAVNQGLVACLYPTPDGKVGGDVRGWIWSRDHEAPSVAEVARLRRGGRLPAES